MTIDIKAGDQLIIGSDTFPIFSVGEHTIPGFNDPSFLKIATVSCSTKRGAENVGGDFTAPVENLTGLLCTPFQPLTEEVIIGLGLNDPHEKKTTFIADATSFVEIIVTVGVR